MSASPAAQAPEGGPLDAQLVEASHALGLPLTAEQKRQLVEYVALLQHWNRTYNLIADLAPDAILRRHIVDCLAVVASFRRALGHTPGRPRILDVGSGGGLPGLVLAVMDPGVDVLCVDSVGKKAAFIQHAASALQLANLESRHSRVEALDSPPFDLITCRAFGSLAELVRATTARLAADGVWAALKGRRPDVEIEALPRDVEMFHVEPIVVPGLAGERCIVWMKRRQPLDSVD